MAPPTEQFARSAKMLASLAVVVAAPPRASSSGNQRLTIGVVEPPSVGLSERRCTHIGGQSA